MAAEAVTPPTSAQNLAPASAGQQSSHVRAKEAADAGRATRRVVEYLKMLGLGDHDHIVTIADSVTLPTWTESGEQHAQRAVALLQARIESWQKETFSDLPSLPDPTWLRAFVAAHPRALLDEPKAARALAATFGDPRSGTPPIATPFARQALGRPQLPSWLRGLLAPGLTAAAATTLVATRALHGIQSPLEAAWLALFAGLLGHTALGFFTALRGWSRETESELADATAAPLEGAPESISALPRTAVAIPIYHEHAAEVFARVAAMRESLLALPNGPAIELFVLSDSRDPLIAAEEERALRRVTGEGDSKVPIYYRRRTRNVGQKAGNLAEFFQRWGHRYAYVIVLDADSLMRGETMVELIRRIERAPRVALLQAPIVPIGAETLLARALAWSTTVAGPLFTRGLMRWAGPHANYYGHNAILRTRAFLECCALPTLAGKPPFGGPLLSHDFVEAALLCRGGWQVRLASDLTGSYEELPPTLAQYVARDRRWCQGNLQHLRVLLAPGLRPMSRLHLLLGMAAYLAAPAWVAFMALGVVLGERGRLTGGHAALGLLLPLVLLVGPRLLGVLAKLSRERERAEHGGALRLIASFFFELLLSALLGPLLLLHHTRMVASVVLGRAVGWGAARRSAARGFSATSHAELGNMALGALLVLGSGALSMTQALWLTPVWLPLVLAVAVSVLVGSVRLGRASERLGLLLVATETHPDPLAERAHDLRTLTEGDSSGRFRDLILDPVLVNAHVERLGKSARPAPDELRERALRMGPAGLSEPERQALLDDPESVRWLHREGWRAWPTETWQLGRRVAQLPLDS